VLRGHYKDSMALLMDELRKAAHCMRMDCAKALLPYQHARMGEQGKNEETKDRARELAGGKRGPYVRTACPEEKPHQQRRRNTTRDCKPSTCQ